MAACVLGGSMDANNPEPAANPYGKNAGGSGYKFRWGNKRKMRQPTNYYGLIRQIAHLHPRLLRAHARPVKASLNRPTFA